MGAGRAVRSPWAQRAHRVWELLQQHRFRGDRTSELHVLRVEGDPAPLLPRRLLLDASLAESTGVRGPIQRDPHPPPCHRRISLCRQRLLAARVVPHYSRQGKAMSSKKVDGPLATAVYRKSLNQESEDSSCDSERFSLRVSLRNSSSILLRPLTRRAHDSPLRPPLLASARLPWYTHINLSNMSSRTLSPLRHFSIRICIYI